MKNICICMPFTKGNRVIIATSLNFTMCSRKFNDMFLGVFCVGVYTLLCFVISVSATQCAFQRVWLGIFSLNPDEGFAWSDGSPVSTIISHEIYLLMMFRGLCMYFGVFTVIPIKENTNPANLHCC